MCNSDWETLLSEQTGSEMEFVVAIQNALVLIVIVLEHSVVRCLANLGARGLEIGGLIPDTHIAHCELMLVDRLLEDMRDRKHV